MTGDRCAAATIFDTKPIEFHRVVTKIEQRLPRNKAASPQWVGPIERMHDGTPVEDDFAGGFDAPPAYLLRARVALPRHAGSRCSGRPLNRDDDDQEWS
jgi:hypothetical protein